MVSGKIMPFPTTEQGYTQQLMELKRSCEMMADFIIAFTRHGTPDVYIPWPSNQQHELKDSTVFKAVVRALYKKGYTVRMPPHNEPDMLYIQLTRL